MKTLVISDYGVRIRFRNGLFLVEKNGEKMEIPPLNIEQVIIATGGVMISSKAIRKMIDYGIDLVILDTWGMPIGRVYPPYISRTVETRRAQYRAYGCDRGIQVVKEIIYAKIMNQAGLLKRYYGITRDKALRDSSLQLIQLADQVYDVDDEYDNAINKLRHMEAEAARIYWSSYSLLIPRDCGFDSRDQDSTDPINTLLNYGYGLLYKDVWRALVLAGLDPYAGYMHVDRSGKPVLVYDFVEQFRQLIDFIILRIVRRGWRPMIEEGLLTLDTRRYLIRHYEEFMDSTKTRFYTEQPISIRQAMKRSAYLLASFLRGESLFRGFIWEW